MRWGAGAPQSLVDSLSSLSMELVDAFHLIFRGRIASLHSGLGFRLIGNDSLLLVHLCLGDNHTPSHLTSLPQICPVAHFAQGVTPPPIKDLGYQSKIRLMMSANTLQFSCYRTKGRVTRRIFALPLGAVTCLQYEQVPSRLQALGPAFNPGYQTIFRLIMAAILQVSCNRTNRRAMRRILSLPPWRCWLTTLSASFPAASKSLARLSNKLPDENSSDHGCNSSAGLLQLDEQDGDEENYLPASLALLLDYITSKFPVAPKPLAQPSICRFHVFGAAGFVQESSQRSSNISWFDHVQFACASTQSQFEPRFYEGISFSSIMPSISKVMKVYHSPCQEWGLKVISQRYDLRAPDHRIPDLSRYQ